MFVFRFYSKTPTKTAGRVTVVGKHEDSTLKIAVAVCSKKDNFVKKYGRGRAEKRLEKNSLYNEFPMETCSTKDFFDKASQVAEEVSKSKIVCPRAVKTVNKEVTT